METVKIKLSKKEQEIAELYAKKNNMNLADAIKSVFLEELHKYYQRNKDTVDALIEVSEFRSGKKKVKKYSSVEELRKDLKL